MVDVVSFCGFLHVFSAFLKLVWVPIGSYRFISLLWLCCVFHYSVMFYYLFAPLVSCTCSHWLPHSARCDSLLFVIVCGSPCCSLFTIIIVVVLRLFAVVCGYLLLFVRSAVVCGCLRLPVVVQGVLHVLGMVCRRCCFRLLIVILVADRSFSWSFAIHWCWSRFCSLTMHFARLWVVCVFMSFPRFYSWLSVACGSCVLRSGCLWLLSAVPDNCDFCDFRDYHYFYCFW